MAIPAGYNAGTTPDKVDCKVATVELAKLCAVPKSIKEKYRLINYSTLN